MTPEDLKRAQKESAQTLEAAAERGRGEDRVRAASEVLGADPEVRTQEKGRTDRPAPPWNPPAPPDLKAVNESWNAAGRGALASLVKGAGSDAQVKFNSDQVQLDNALVAWIAAHFEATHRHYDRLIGEMQQRLDDVDTRHRSLEMELVRHVHEMARRIDVVLGEGEKGRVSH